MAPSSDKPLKILYLVTHFGFVRNFDQSLQLLLERGHKVQIGFDAPKHSDDERLVRHIASIYPELDFHVLPKRGKEKWYALSWSLRLLADWLRYLDPVFAEAHLLRGRASIRIPPTLTRLFSLPGFRSTTVVRLARRTVSGLERLVPLHKDVDRLGGHGYDMLLVTPLVTFGSIQVDYVRWARRVGIPTAALIASWDNLTTKGLVHEVPDMVCVWNDHQVREAVELHDVPADRVVKTGAPPYDYWFDREPNSDRKTLCRRAGLDPESPYFLYVCSSPFIAPEEVDFVRRYVKRLREERALGLDKVGVLVRPHPLTAPSDSAALATLNETAQVSVWPSGGQNPTDEARRDDYFDSIHHAAAVVGINTSAMIEAAVVGRPIHTLLSEQYKSTQNGTLHFRYLLPEAGGPLHAAPAWAEHAQDLVRSLSSDEDRSGQRAHFVRSFVRPLGGAPTPSERLVAEIEACAARPVRRGNWSHKASVVMRPAMWPLARAAFVKLQRSEERKRIAPPTKAAARAGTPDPVQALVEEIDALANHIKGPIVAGPWFGPGDMELLVWIPLLRWAVQQHPGLEQRLVAVSRGNVEHWYSGVASRYIDADRVFELPTRAALDLVVEASMSGPRDLEITQIERDLADAACQMVGTSDTGLFAPISLRRTLHRVGKTGNLPALEERLRYEPLTVPAAAIASPYVVFGAIDNGLLPERERYTRMLRQELARLAEDSSVVVVGDAIGNVGDVASQNGHSVSRVTLEPGSEADEIARLVAGASAFVGPIGGLPVLGSMVGTPVRALVWAEEDLDPLLRPLASRRLRGEGFGTFDTHPLRDQPLSASEPVDLERAVGR